jgi:hypothetical protein
MAGTFGFIGEFLQDGECQLGRFVFQLNPFGLCLHLSQILSNPLAREGFEFLKLVQIRQFQPIEYVLQ